MPIYEIKLTGYKMICVEADNEDEAFECARDNMEISMEFEDARIEDEYDRENPDHAKWIKQYESEGEFYQANS